jgi:UDP-glucose 4-epimerase
LKEGCLVTGANGFIGSALCARLSGKRRVRALVRSERAGPWDDTVVVDIERDDVPAAALEGVDVVFHLAAHTHALSETRGGDEAAYRRLNVDGTRRILAASRNAGVRRFVLASSVKAIGEGGAEMLDENTPPAPVTPYGKTKLEAEREVLGGGWVPEPAVLRLSLVYGPGNKGNLTAMIDAVDRGAFPPLPRVANKRSMVHVEDAVDALLLAAGSPEAVGRSFIVTDGRAYSTREMYEWICEGLGRPVPRWSVPPLALRALARLGDLVGLLMGRRWKFDTEGYRKLFGSAWYSNAAIVSTLGFEPRRDLRTAMPEIVASMR